MVSTSIDVIASSSGALAEHSPQYAIYTGIFMSPLGVTTVSGFSYR
jgi:hypothetical protein